jgi:hypothetical protein
MEIAGEATIPGSSIPDSSLSAFPTIGSFTNVDLNQSLDFKAQKITKNQVSSAKVDGVWIQILNPENQDFSFLISLHFFAKAGDQEAEVARKLAISQLALRTPNPVLNLDSTRVELKSYVAAPMMSIIGRAEGTLPPADTRLKVVVSLLVEPTS